MQYEFVEPDECEDDNMTHPQMDAHAFMPTNETLAGPRTWTRLFMDVDVQLWMHYLIRGG